MSRLSVLTLSWYPPARADTGDRVRLHGLSAGLAASADLTVLSFSDDRPTDDLPFRDERAPRRVEYRYGPRTKLRALATGRSVHELALPGRWGRTAVERALAATEPDVVIVNQVPPWPLVPRRWWPRTVVDTHNAEVPRLGRLLSTSPRAMRPLLRQQLRCAGVLERRLATAAAEVWCVSPEDSAYFAGLGARAAVLPNGTAPARVLWAGRRQAGAPTRLLFLANLGYSANIDALRWFRDEWARRDDPPWTLDVVGTGAPLSLSELVAREPRIRLVGRVEEVGTSYAGHDALLVPLRRGGGSRLKVVEGLAHGIPVISTRVGVEGLDLRPGVDYLPAEDADGFRSALRRLAAEPGLAAAMSAGGREIAAGYDWRLIAAQAAERLVRVVAGSPPPAAGRRTS